MSQPIASQEDIFVWPDGTWCWREEYWEMDHMSDDFMVLFENTPEWEKFVVEMGVL